MAACIVCNQQTNPDDLEDVGDTVSLSARLEKVLDEAVPQDAVMCSLCQFDLSQIEMYYTLLIVFKKRYADTRKQRTQVKESQNDETKSNLLREMAGENLQNIFVAGNSLQHSSPPLHTDSDIMNNSKNLSPFVKLEIIDVRTVTEELQMKNSLSNSLSSIKETTGNLSVKPEMADPSEHSGEDQDQTSNWTGGEMNENSSDECDDNAWASDIGESETTTPKLHESPEVESPPDILPDGNSGQVVKCRGRPRRTLLFPMWTSVKTEKQERSRTYDQSEAVSSHDMVASPRKRGRPRKNEQPSQDMVVSPRKWERPPKTKPMSDIQVPATGIKKCGRQRKNAAPNDTVHKFTGIQKKRGRPKNDESSEFIATGGTAVSVKKHAQPRKSAAMKVDPTENKETRKDVFMNFKETESEESSLGERNTDVSDTDDPSYAPDLMKQPSLPLSTSEYLQEDGDSPPMTSQETSSTEKKRVRPRKDAGLSFTPVAGTSEGQTKGQKPKKRRRPTLTCPICNRVCPKSNLKAHMLMHSEDRPHVCSVCGKAFKVISTLTEHQKTHDEVRTFPFKCEICGKGFIRRRLVERHAAVHTDEKPYQCDQCDKTFKCQGYLKIHVKFHHVEGRKYLCNICGFAYFTESSLKIHVATHGGNEAKQWKCDTCGKGMWSKYQLQQHKLIHDADHKRERHLCPFCGKALLSKYYLGLHVAQHTGTAKHSCTQCEQTFQSAYAQRKHMMMHRGETSLHCSECGKGFRNSGNLNQHMMIHTGERPFVCTCGQAFRGKDKLQKHMRTRKHAEFEAKRRNSQSLDMSLAGTDTVATASVATASVATASVATASAVSAGSSLFVSPMSAGEPWPVVIVPAVDSQEQLSPNF